VTQSRRYLLRSLSLALTLYTLGAAQEALAANFPFSDMSDSDGNQAHSSGDSVTNNVVNGSTYGATGTISGSGVNVVVDGTGASTPGTTTFELRGTQTYTGTTAVQNGGVLVLNGAVNNTIANSSGVDVDATSVLRLSNNQTIRNLSGASGAVVDNQVNTLTIATSTAKTFAGDITGSGDVAVAGSGTLNISSSLSLTGGVSVGDTSTLLLSSNSAISTASQTFVAANATLKMTADQIINGLNGSGHVVIEGAKLINNFTGTQTFSGVIADGATAGSFQITGSGNFHMAAAATYTGTTQLDVSSLMTADVNDAFAHSSRMRVDGTFDMAGHAQHVTDLIGSNNGIVDMNGANLTVDINAGTTYAGVLQDTAGSAQLHITNTGNTGNVLVLNNVSNTYSGGTRVDANATLSINRGENLGTGSLDLEGGALRFTGNGRNVSNNIVAGTGGGTLTLTGANSDEFSGVISGGNLHTASASGTLTLSGNNSFTGALTVDSGVTTLTGTNAYTGGTVLNGRLITTVAALGTGGIVNNGTFLEVTSDGTINQTLEMNSGAAVNVDNTTNVTISGVVSGDDFYKVGAGTLTLSRNNTYTNSLHVDGGTLNLSGTNVFTSTTTVSSGATLALGVANAIARSSGVTVDGTLNLGGFHQTLNGLTGTGTIIMGGGTFSDNSGSTFTSTVGNGATAGGGITVSGNGTWQVTGTNAYSGATQILSGSTLQNDGTVSSSTLTVNSGATLKGSGTATGAVVNNGTLAPGNSPGTLTVGSYSGSGNLDVELTGSNTAGNFDRLIATTTADISATKLNYQPLAPSPATKYMRGTSYTIVTANSGLTGAFTNSAEGQVVSKDSTGANADNAATIAASSNPALAFRTHYTATTATVEIVRAEFFGQLAGATANQRAVGSIFDPLQLSASGDMDTLFNQLSSLSSEQQKQLLQSFAGEINGDMANASFNTMSAFNGLLAKRLGGDCNTADSLSGNAQRARLGQTGYAANNYAWSCAYGAFGSVDGDSNAGSVDTTLAGFATGVEYRPSAPTMVRMGFGYGRQMLSQDSASASADVNALQAGAYGSPKHQVKALT
jgi:autotransporter-associated beta strand protein